MTVADYIEDPQHPGLYRSSSTPGTLFRFDVPTLSMVPAGPANAGTSERCEPCAGESPNARAVEPPPATPPVRERIDADEALKRLSFGERLRLLALMGFGDLDRAEILPVLAALSGVPGDKRAFYRWAEEKGIRNPDSKDAWDEYFESFFDAPANAETRPRIRTKRHRAQARRANGILDDFLSFLAMRQVVNAGGAAPASASVSQPAAAAAPARPPQEQTLRSAFEGQLVQVEGDPKVFLIENGAKRWVTSEAIMRSRFNGQLVNGRWNNVSTISSQIMAAFPDSAPVAG